MQLTAEQIIAERNKQLREMLDDSHNTLLMNLEWASETLMMPRVVESLFISSFLPFLNGTRNPTVDDNLSLNWSRLNIYPSSPFMVVDNQGRDLFVMPALYDSSTIASMSSGIGTVLENFVTGYQAHSVHSRGNAFFNRNINGVLNAVGEKKEKDSLKAIRAILERYAHLVPSAEATKPKQVAAPVSGGLMIDYD